MDSRELDVRALPTLAIPYDITTKELAESPVRFVAGQNTYITPGGKISIAPGLNDTGLTSFTMSNRVDRLAIYETVEASPKVYILASYFNGSSWSAKYLRLDAGSPAWTTVGTIRNVQASAAPHEFLVAHGVVFIKSFGIAEKIGTVVFDGTGGTVTLRAWGIDGSNATITYLGTFGVGANPQAVLFGWRYAYAYQTADGHVSNRSIVIGNAGFTGPFTNGIPRVQVLYTTDAQVTKINIYRTSDGGGTFYYLDQINNNSAGGTVNYDDNASASNPGFPKLDNELDVTNIAPSEVSNTYPPPHVDRSNLGSTPEISTPPQYFARRIWIGLGNRLYFSGNEEILNGIPEHSFPAPWGTRGNYIVYQGEVRQIKSAKRALYVNSGNEIGIITGQDLTNFLPDTIVTDIGAAPGHRRAIVSFRDTVFFLSSDLQVYSVTGADAPQLISGPLGSSIRTALAAANSPEIQFEIYSRDSNTWLVVNLSSTNSPANNVQFVYDLNHGFWFTPWNKKISALAFGRLRDSDANKYLVTMTWDGATARLAILDTAYRFDTNAATITPTFTTNSFMVPAGNHINELRKPAHTPVLSYFIVERTKVGGDTVPTISYRLDEFSGSATTVTATDPPYLAQHTSYHELWYPIQLACRRVQLIAAGSASSPFEIQNISFAFQSEAGA